MDFAIALDSQSSEPLYRQLYGELRRAILTGRLQPQQKLPSTRSLAKSLHLSRATVTQCYEQLASEGYLQTAVGSGTFVNAQLPDDLDKIVSSQAIASSNPTASPLQLSNYGANLAKMEVSRFPTLDSPISFKYGEPALDCFPFRTWKKLLARHCGSNPDLLSYATDLLGYCPLREAIANRLKTTRGVDCQADRILITNGSQQGLDLIAGVFINPGDAIAVEEPGYLGARQIFQVRGAKLIFIPVDKHGLVATQLSDIPDVKFIHLTPSHQFPTGAVLPLSRRLELLNWAQQTNAIIVEDDYDSEYRYGARPIPALQGLDCHQRVIYVGTFSKVLFPSLRIGYIVLPEHLTHIFAKARWACDRSSPTIEQQVLTDFINEGHLDRHIRKMRQLYDRRRQTLVRSLEQYLGDKVEIMGDNAGIHLMAKIESDRSDLEVVEAARKIGVGLASTQVYYTEKLDRSQFLFGYSQLNEEEIREGVRRLSHLV